MFKLNYIEQINRNILIYVNKKKPTNKNNDMKCCTILNIYCHS